MCYSIRGVKRQMLESQERPSCPWCESTDVAPIAYGLPTREGWTQMAEAGSIWGGCCVDGYEPLWFCRGCQRRWGRSREDESFYCEFCRRPGRGSWCRDCQEKAIEDAEAILAEASRAGEKASERKWTAARLLTLLMLSSFWAGGAEP